MWSIDRVQIPALWNKGLTGEGVKIGVMGTGIDLTHPDFQNTIIDAHSLVSPDVVDYIGHETAITWLITRMATKAQIVFVKTGLTVYSEIYSIIDACEQLRQAGVQIFNMSFGGPLYSNGADPLSAEANYLADHGALVVAVAGNGGPHARTITSPGSAQGAITVGKTDRSDRVMSVSSRGPTIDGRPKPDLVAPGSEMLVASPRTVGKEAYAWRGCTSIAAPHVTAILALLKQAYPAATSAELRNALLESCDPARGSLSARLRGESQYETGKGRVNGLKAWEYLKHERTW